MTGNGEKKRLRWTEQEFSVSWAPFVLALLPVMLIAHSFDDGWYGDDFVQRTWLADSTETNARAAWLLPGNSPPTNRFHYAAFELFNFADGGERVQHWIERGVMPWWTHPELRVRFFRPLSGITHWIDYTLWPGSPFVMHLHNALWLFAMASIAIVAFRLFLPKNTALLAGLLFVLNDCLSGAAWIAGRNALLAAPFVFATLYCHYRWRAGERRFYFAALLSLIAALLSSESGTIALVLVFCYCLFLEPQPGLKRLLSLLPYFTLVFVWKLLYGRMGYGVDHSGLYVDPLNVSEFVPAIIHTYPAMLQALIVPDLFHHSLAIGVSIGGFLFLSSVPVIQAVPTARYFLCATVLSLLPLCAHRWGANIERLFYIPAFGLSGLLAIVLAYWYERLTQGVNQPAAKVSVSLVVMALVGLSSTSMIQKASKPKNEQHDLMNAVAGYQIGRFEENQSVLLFGTPNSAWHFYCAFLSSEKSGSQHNHPIYILVPDIEYDLKVRNEFSLTINADQWQLNYLDSVWRAEDDFQFQIDDTIDAGAFQVVIIDVDEDQRPRIIQFIFNEPVESPHYHWRQWRLGRWTVTPVMPVE